MDNYLVLPIIYILRLTTGVRRMKIKKIYIMLALFFLTAFISIHHNSAHFGFDSADNGEHPMKESENKIKKDTEPQATEDVADIAELPEKITTVFEEKINRFHNKNIVAIGDSLTQGVGDQTKRGGYVGIIERTMNENHNNTLFFNFGKRGLRSEQLMKRLEEEEITSTLSTADIILITVGANDIMQVAKENILDLNLSDFTRERAVYEQNLRTIVEKMRKISPTSEIYFIGFYNPFEQYFQEIEELKQIVDIWNETTRKIAEENEAITYIPVDDLFHTGNLMADDHFHPNYNGYHVIAERVLEYISNEAS